MGKIPDQDQNIIRVRTRVVTEYIALRTRKELDQRCLTHMVLYSIGCHADHLESYDTFIRFYVERIIRTERAMSNLERYARLFDGVFELSD